MTRSARFRRAFAGAVSGALGALLLVAVVPAGAASQPRYETTHTRSQVSLRIDDNGVTVNRNRPTASVEVQAGIVTFDVADARTDTSTPATVRFLNAPGIVLDPGPSERTLAVLRTYTLAAAWDGSPPLPDTVSLTVGFPMLAPPAEREHRVSVTVGRSAINTPRRDSRFVEPRLPFSDDPVHTAPWTTVSSGPGRIQLRNTSGVRQNCTVTQGSEVSSVILRRSATRTIAVDFAGSRADVSCTAGATTTQFALLVR